MSVEHTPSLLSLSDELFYCLLDRLDTNDILFSFRNVCTRFREMTCNYKLYKIHITSNSTKAEIHRICRIIRPENVVSLVLTDTHSERQRIELFLSLIDIHKFTRLYSLDLFGINVCHLMTIVHHFITVSTLTSLSLRAFSTDGKNDDTNNILSSVIAMSNLRKLHLRNFYPEMYKMLSLKQSKLEELTIDIITHEELCYILRHLPNLRAFSSSQHTMNETDPLVIPTSFPLLTSLKLQCSSMIIDQIESLLSCTSSLVHLHLISHFSSFNFLQRFSRWEQFIRQKLPLLEKFRFYIKTCKYQYENVKDIELLLQSFRTPFWLKHKRWYVTCKYINDDTRSDMMLYSASHSDIDFPDNQPSDTLSYSTTTTEHDDITKTSSMWSVRLNISEFTDAISLNQVNQPTDRIFNHITQLALDIDWPINSFNFLSTLADFSGLNEIWLFLSGFHYFESETLNTLLDLACNVQTLGISYDNESTIIPEDICSVISRRIKHLKVKTTEIECIQMVLEYVKNVSSITFVCHQGASKSWPPVIEWLNRTGHQFSRSKDYRFLRIWSDKISSESSQITTVR